ncbi:MAG TPA: hypothetical protein VI731_10370 [Bacteroidia bacterium]|nr:hypothetical protein [Bacteroidia bacterium]
MEKNKNPEEENTPQEINPDPEPQDIVEPEAQAIPVHEIIVPDPQPQTNDMEVHTHTHPPRKKWTHYFWEFLMLFLAVFCGFLAEYKLEHVIENQREVTLMRTLTEDLHADEITLKNYFNWRTGVNQDFDSMLVVLANHGRDKNVHAVYEKSSSAVLRFGLPDIHEGTIQQLKNAGGLRLVRKKDVINAINKHYLAITRMKSIFETEILLRVKLAESFGEILNASLLVNKDTPPDSFRLFTTDKTKINGCMNSILIAKQMNRRLIVLLDSTRTSTVRLNHLIRKEYDIE